MVARFDIGIMEAKLCDLDTRLICLGGRHLRWQTGPQLSSQGNDVSTHHANISLLVCMGIVYMTCILVHT